MPPTIALNAATIQPGSTVAASGQSLPNSQIEIYFYKVDDGALSFPKAALAYSLPILTTKSDHQGNFNLNLPTAYSSNYRLYVATKYQDNLSPKSNTLLYVMPSLIWLFWLENKILIIFLPIFILTLTFFIYLLVQYSLPKKHYLPVIRNFLPAIR